MSSCDPFIGTGGRLPIPVQFLPGEGLHGYLLRAAEENLYERLNWVANLGGACPENSKSDFLLLGEHTERLAHVFGCSAEDLELRGYTGSIYEGDRVVTGFGGQHFPAHAIEYKTPKVCPSCLQDTPFIRQVWDLSLLTVCPHHGERLINVCPNCAKPITWNRSNVEACDCGGDFTFAESLPSSPEAMALARVIQNSVLPTEDHLPVECGFPRELLEMDYVTLGRVVAYLGSAGQGERFISPPKLHCTPLDNRTTHLETAANLLADWPRNWWALIKDRLREGHRGSRNAGLQRDFGKLYLHLYAKENDGVFGFIHEAFTSGLQDMNYGVNLLRRGGSRLLQVSSPEIGYMTGAEARRELGISKAKLKKAIESGLIEVILTSRTGDGVRRITRDSVDRYKARPRGKVIGIKDLACFIGVSIPTALQLLEAGMIPACRGVGAKGKEPWRIHIEDALEFRFRLNLQTQVCEKSETTWLFTASAARAKLNAGGVDALTFLSDIMSGKIKTFRTTQVAAQLDNMFFDQENLDDCLREWAREEQAA